MRAPLFWSDRGSWLALRLSPLGTVYGAITAWRLAQASPWRAPIPVICVGNVTAGGSGKTPVVQALVKRAIQRGIAVHCLSRGYGGTIAGPVRVDPAHHGFADVGDEALLHAEIAPTWIARDRNAGARAAVAAGAELLVLDDGLQNPALAYDLSVLVIDGGFGFGNGHIIPAGPLREPVQAAASRVAAAVIIGSDIKNSAGLLPAALPVIRAAIVPRDPDLRGKSIVAFAGLGRPQKFYDTLSAAGAIIVGWFPFPDHHGFSADDLRMLENAAIEKSATLVTTEKDFVRLPVSMRDRVTALAIDLVADDPREWDALLDRVMP